MFRSHTEKPAAVFYTEGLAHLVICSNDADLCTDPKYAQLREKRDSRGATNGEPRSTPVIRIHSSHGDEAFIYTKYG